MTLKFLCQIQYSACDFSFDGKVLKKIGKSHSFFTFFKEILLDDFTFQVKIKVMNRYISIGVTDYLCVQSSQSVGITSIIYNSKGYKSLEPIK